MAAVETKENLLEVWSVAIVDNKADNRADIRRMLRSACERRLVFIEADTGAAGVVAIRGAAAPPHCVLLGCNLPDMNPPQVLAELLDTDGMPVCPIVVVTSADNREDGRRVLQAGAQDYICKDWTSPQALNRTIENARESWAIARELRQRKDALRIVTHRETFRGVFGDATRDLTNEEALKRLGSQLLGLHLQVNRVMYGEVLDGENIVIGQSYVDGVQQIEGTHKLQDYGPKLLATLRSGKNVIVSDVRTDAGYSDSEKTAYAAMGIVASLGIPVLKNGQLLAVLGIHQNAPRQWNKEEIAIAREIAERTWSAVEHARAGKKLLASQTQLSQIVAMMPSFSAVMRGPDHIVELANQSFYDIAQRGPEILGKTHIEAFPELAEQGFTDLLDKVYRTGKSFEATAMHAFVRSGPDQSESEIFVDFVYLPLRDAVGQISGVFIHGTDRTAQFRATQALAQREREMRSLADNAPDVLTRFDRQLRHVFVNSAIEKITGRKVDELLGKSNRELGMPPHLCDQWDAAITHVFDHGVPTSLDFEFETPSEGLRCFTCQLVPEFGDNGTVVSVLGVTHDITDRKLYEKQMSEQAQRKDEFLATLAHELRNPLAPIRTGLQVLKLAPDSSAAAHMLPVMERQIAHMVRLIDDLMDVSRITSGKIVLRQERLTLQAIVTSAVEASMPLIDAAGHALKVDLPDATIWLHADLTRLSQVLSNLLNNSAKYTPKGGQISLLAGLQGDQVRIIVTDNGMGIPAGMLSGVFDMFAQINRTLDRAEGGLGLGLSLVKTLVQLHGGTVHADSRGINMGSQFTVILPVAYASASQPCAVAVGPFVDAATRRRILVVDDNIDAAETLAMLMELLGHETKSAFSGQQALDTALSFCPDVVFLDIGLPDMTGYQVARALLANPATASAQLIALTGWGTEDDIRKSKKAGFHAHLTKPVDPAAVESVLLTLLSPIGGQSAPKIPTSLS